MERQGGERLPLERGRCRVLLLLYPVVGVSTCRLGSSNDGEHTIVVSNATLVAILKAVDRGPEREPELAMVFALVQRIPLYLISVTIGRKLGPVMTCHYVVELSGCCSNSC